MVSVPGGAVLSVGRGMATVSGVVLIGWGIVATVSGGAMLLVCWGVVTIISEVSLVERCVVTAVVLFPGKAVSRESAVLCVRGAQLVTVPGVVVCVVPVLGTAVVDSEGAAVELEVSCVSECGVSVCCVSACWGDCCGRVVCTGGTVPMALGGQDLLPLL